MLPVDACICDTDATLKTGRTLGRNLLVARTDVGLDHDTNNGALTFPNLVGNDLGNLGLVVVVLLGVACNPISQTSYSNAFKCKSRLTVRAVDHDGQFLALVRQHLLSCLNTVLVEIGALASSSQDNETVLVALGAGNGSETLFCDTHEVVLGGSSANGVNGNTKAAIGSVLEADGERQAGGKLTVKLGLSCSGTDGANRDAVGKELGGDGVEHLCGNGHAIGGQVNEELAGNAQALVDLEGRVDIRVVNQAFPADGCARLLEVGAHDDAEIAGELLGELFETASVFVGSFGVVNGAGADDNQ